MEFRAGSYYKSKYVDDVYFKVLEYLSKEAILIKYSKPHVSCSGTPDMLCKQVNKKYKCQGQNSRYCMEWPTVSCDYLKISNVEGKLRIGE